MPFSRPTLSALIERNQADIESRLPGADTKLRRTFLGVISRALSGAVHGLYGYLDWQSKQIMPDTADAENLDRWASIWLKVPRKVASFATGSATFTGTNGAVIPAGTIVTRSDSLEFTTSADATITAGVATAVITAKTAGLTGNTSAGSNLTLVSPISGVNSAATVATGGITGGADQETDSALRTRLLARIQQPPQGGAKADYQEWALEVAGVTRAWVYPEELGVGTVTVRFVTDDDPAGIIPSGTKVTDVQSYIDNLRPVTAAVTVVAPIAVPLNFTISGLNPNTQAVKDGITASLTDLIRREAEPGVTLLISHIREAISVAAGESNHVLVAPSADVAHTVGQIATMGTITWV